MKDFRKSLDKFKNNTAMKLFTQTTEAKAPAKKESKPKDTGGTQAREQTANHIKSMLPQGYKLNYDVIEKRTKRYLLSLQPSLFTRIEREAKKRKMSINDYILNILQEQKELKK